MSGTNVQKIIDFHAVLSELLSEMPVDYEGLPGVKLELEDANSLFSRRTD